MDGNPPSPKALSLEPVELPAPASDAARPVSDDSKSEEEKSKRDLRIRTADEFLARAAKEYQEGQVDQALWRRAADQGASDASLVIAAYLRARATALQLQQKQARGSQDPPRRPAPTRAPSGRGDPSDSRAEFDSAEKTGAPFWRRRPLVTYSAAGVAALVIATAIVWVITSPREIEPTRTPVDSAAAAAPSQPPSPLPARTAKAAAEATDQGDLHPNFAARVEDLKQEGNWNVLVLYASDWTRKEPDNASAWHELSLGYAKIRQFEDAFHAAAKAVELSPRDALLWNDLGQANLSLQRLPEAKVAFERALALRPDDPDSLCGAALVAQRDGRASDAEALAARAKNASGGCSGVNMAVAVKH